MDEQHEFLDLDIISGSSSEVSLCGVEEGKMDHQDLVQADDISCNLMEIIRRRS